MRTCATRLAHDAENHRQTQPRALAHFLGREEGLECALDDFRAHPGAGVAQRHENTVPTDDFGWQLLVPGTNICRLDYQDAASGHSVARVESDIEERRLDLTHIDQHRPKPARQDMPNISPKHR